MRRPGRTLMTALFGGLALGVVMALLPAGAHAAATVPAVPDDFRWGVATSGYQSEGSAPASNWSRYDDGMEPYLNSVDFLNRYREDIANAASLGVDTFRFGVEWARVEPEPGVIDPAALAFYDDVVAEIRSHGMTPMITLSHWVHPAWFADQGAWANPGAVDRFLAYAELIVPRYAGDGTTWITFNEPVIYLQHELLDSDNPLPALALAPQVINAHNRTYDLIHRTDPDALVSSNAAYIPGVQPALDVLFLHQMKLDFIGLDYYYGVALDNYTASAALTGKFWEVKPAPEGFYNALKSYHARFPGKPIWIIENGMATDNGKPRADGYTRSQHLQDHLYWMQRAMAEGVPVIGYNYWSITDNYEWGSYRPRFGLWTVDVVTDPTLTRRPTDGVATYTDVIARGGVPADYVPVAPPGLCNIDNLLGSCAQPLLSGLLGGGTASTDVLGLQTLAGGASGGGLLGGLFKKSR
ncbi:glycosyl hydrolase, family 1 [Aeromicrobium marinum DSM 15272]|uniref:Glycosyl hydrolase, family 1 n=1 Tax=Aeromicrobium marinum DSM 15272 TaxID=585531 RepID=E2SEM7_9ACTN|nr:family 1 glycosylhydrolase [Aeromicrobium marinum]EFQ82324.1 glycosyl hydrolase, family 1 [Aeromicrobium marinum DSM 15272]